jgi:hypothetical protein
MLDVKQQAVFKVNLPRVGSAKSVVTGAVESLVRQKVTFVTTGCQSLITSYGNS